MGAATRIGGAGQGSGGDCQRCRSALPRKTEPPHVEIDVSGRLPRVNLTCHPDRKKKLLNNDTKNTKVSWCSWLSHQSNTLKVSGSSPGEAISFLALISYLSWKLLYSCKISPLILPFSLDCVLLINQNSKECLKEISMSFVESLMMIRETILHAKK